MSSTEATRWHAATSLQDARAALAKANDKGDQVQVEADQLAYLLRQNNLARRFHAALRGGK